MWTAKICGHADIELTEVGYAQAEELAQLVSDLERPITKNLCLTIEAGPGNGPNH